jgi:hypothetical protein
MRRCWYETKTKERETSVRGCDGAHVRIVGDNGNKICQGKGNDEMRGEREERKN